MFTGSRFRPLHVALAILLAGWVPTVLMAIVAYGILSDTLEEKIVVGRRTLVKTLASLIGYDLLRTGEIVEYYRTFPPTAEMLREKTDSVFAQDWVASIYYGQPRIDGIFLAKPDGTILASLPRTDAIIGQVYPTEARLDVAADETNYLISPVHARPLDGRETTAIIAPVRTKQGELLGYIGAQILVERLGRRLAGYDFGEASSAQVIDQAGLPIFTNQFEPAPPGTPAEAPLLELLRNDPDGIFRFHGDLYTASGITGTPWTALLRQPLAVAYRPVQELVTKTTLLATWLVVGTALAAVLVSRLYKRQIVADARLQREMLFSEKILSSMPLGVALVDSKTSNLIQVNQSFREMAHNFGNIPAGRDILGMPVDEVSFVSRDRIQSALSGGSPLQVPEQRAVSANGEAHFLALNLLPIQDPRQETLGVLLVVSDDTADVTLRKELIAASAAKDRFLALLSHELRNPLSPVITMVHELEQRARKDPETQSALEIIRRNVELEARLIDDLLDITRIANNKLSLAFETVDADQTILRACEICDREIHEKGLGVKLDLAAPRHHVRADPARLQQIFWNLIKNAVKFTPAGTITIRSRNEDGNLVVDVIDTGIGIEPEIQAKIFTAFEQGGTSITKQFGGLGLGLAISQAMVQAHKGTLSVASAGPGNGATFTVRLGTVQPQDVVPASPAAAGPPPETGGLIRRVLVVDDHEDTCSGMEMLLKRRGYSVRTAESVAAALKAAAEERFDVVISDLGLPDGTGLDLMRRLREKSDIKGIALTGYGMESDLDKSREAGFSEHLIKPVNVERLDAALKALL